MQTFSFSEETLLFIIIANVENSIFWKLLRFFNKELSIVQIQNKRSFSMILIILLHYLVLIST